MLRMKHSAAGNCRNVMIAVGDGDAQAFKSAPFQPQET